MGLFFGSCIREMGGGALAKRRQVRFSEEREKPIEHKRKIKGVVQQR